ncbi:unnamed protein product [Orchesella dallaii]|uniref:Carboxylesterase type B domain-containing protein n=1 Tax=Orchesella dallaii TaxID=48710 RepID=A0ABP1PXF1_9HEXA
MRWFVFAQVAIIGSLFGVGYFHALDGPIVNTTYGAIQGILGLSRNGTIFHKFLGIPYAAAPVDELRFEPPQLPEKWEGIRNGAHTGSECLQIELLFGYVTGHEDCLFLNVFTRNIPTCTPTPDSPCDDKDLLPVMVYIHGGFLHNGGSNLYQPNYFMDEDVVFVTMNYRLAALGFLSTGDDIIRGNMGFKDQTMALRWVNQNIRAFGGDPKRITLFGESCGGMSVHYHMLSPMSKGLVSRYLSQSGIALHFWTLKKDPKRQAYYFGQRLGCLQNDTKELALCLKTVPAADIVETYRGILNPLRDHVLLYKAVVEVVDDENAFITKHPRDILQSGNFTRRPWMTGFNSAEGLFLGATILGNNRLAQMAQNKWNEFAPKLLVYEKNDNASQKIFDHYFGNTSDITTLSNINTYGQMIGDRVFYPEIHQTIMLQSKFSPVYAYQYSYRGLWTTVNLFYGIHGHLPRIIEGGWSALKAGNGKAHDWVNHHMHRTVPNYGTSHSDELAVQFYMPWASNVYEEHQDYPMSVEVVKLWVAYATMTNQTEMVFRNVTWRPVKAAYGTANYLDINMEPRIINITLNETIEFWGSLNLTDIS